MVDIIFGDRAKKLFEWSRFHLIKEYDIDSEASPPLKYISDVIDEVCRNTRPGHQRQRMRDYKDIAVWAVMKKHLGSAVVHDLLFKLGNDEIRSLITPDMCIPHKMKWTDKALKKLVTYVLTRMYDDKWCNPAIIYDDLYFSGNAAVQKIHRELLQTLKEHEHEDLKEIIEFFLWILVKDTGYRDQFFWIFNEIGNKEIRGLVEDYVKPPCKWAPNAWLASKDTTAEAHKNHRLPKTTLAYCEQVNVPGFQKKQLENIIGDKIHR